MHHFASVQKANDIAIGLSLCKNRCTFRRSSTKN